MFVGRIVGRLVPMLAEIMDEFIAGYFGRRVLQFGSPATGFSSLCMWTIIREPLAMLRVLPRRGGRFHAQIRLPVMHFDRAAVLHTGNLASGLLSDPWYPFYWSVCALDEVRAYMYLFLLFRGSG